MMHNEMFNEDLQDTHSEDSGENLSTPHPRLDERIEPQAGSTFSRHISLSISTKPPLGWGKQDALREFLQNCLDGDDAGHRRCDANLRPAGLLDHDRRDRYSSFKVSQLNGDGAITDVL